MRSAAIMRKPAIFRTVTIRSNIVSLHSRLYHLEPVGIGTPYTESLTSYITRLAEAHSVSGGQLFDREIVPLVNKPYLLATDRSGKSNPLMTFRLALRCLNGAGETAADFIRALEALTLRSSLHSLTMLTWGNVIGETFLLRDSRAWCPACYGEWHANGGIVYDPLIWHLRMVEICPYHKRDLVTKCQQCSFRLPVYSHNSRAGTCSRCGYWLGATQNTETLTVGESDDAESEYRQWTVSQMGMLIAATQSMSNIPQRASILAAVSLCIDKIAPQNLRAFAYLYNTSREVVHQWKIGKHVPRIDFLLRMCFKLRIDVLDFILKPNEIFNSNSKDSYWESMVIGKTTVRLRREYKRKILLDALDEDPPPHMREVARRVGLVNYYQLEFEFPELYEKIKNRYRSSVKFHESSLRAKTIKVDDVTLKKAFDKALKETPPPSIEAFARRYGYTASPTIRQRFPKLTLALKEQHKRYLSTKKANVRRRLKAILKLPIPISMAEACKHLGYKSADGLKNQAPQLSLAISDRYDEYCKRRWANIHRYLLEALKRYPPPSMKEVVESIDASRVSLYRHFPDLCRSISARYSKYRNATALIKKQQLKNEVTRVVSELCAQNICPSEKRVRKLLSIPICLGTQEFYRIYLETRNELNRTAYLE